MLQRINSNKRNFLLPFLALFYFVIVANALHPYFHTHSDTYCGNGNKKLISQLFTSHVDSFSVSPNRAHHSCPICNFFAVCSVLKTTVIQWDTITHLNQHVDAYYQLTLLPVLQTGFYIRGPPVTPYC